MLMSRASSSPLASSSSSSVQSTLNQTMPFKTVFQNLREIFPQVDLRILRAVALEHSEDVAAAIEFIVVEVLKEEERFFPQEGHSLAEDRQRKANDIILRVLETALLSDPKSIACGSVVNDNAPPAVESHSAEVVYVVDSDEECSIIPHHEVKKFNKNPQPEPLIVDLEVSGYSTDALSDYLNSVSDTHGGNDHGQLLANSEPEDHSLLECHVSSCVGLMENGNSVLHGGAQDFLGLEAEENIAVLKKCASLSTLEKCPDLMGYEAVEETNANRAVTECEEHISRHLNESSDTVSAAVSSPHVMKYVAEALKNVNGDAGEYEEHHSRCSAENRSELSCGTEMDSLDDNYMSPTLLSRSGHVVNIDFLEDFITDAKSNKKALLSDVELVLNMMKEVDLLEERAKQAKEDSLLAGQDNFTKVEELKNVLKHARQANDMHAGEVYGEKAILATEARELQSRLCNLSDQRNKSFSIIKEICQTLQARQDAAKQEIEAAEQERLQKEGSASISLKEQELVMDSIVEESKRLQQEAAENCKLKEFLIEKGHIVDTLQGELAVIFEDVILLKDRVSGSLPLSQSLRLTTCSLASSSGSTNHKSQTTCSLASSSSSPNRRSLYIPEHFSEIPIAINGSVESGESQTAINGMQQQQQQQQQQQNSVTGENTRDNHNASSDDEWELLFGVGNF